MCYYTQQSKSPKELTDFFNLNIDYHENLFHGDFINGFSYPNLPIILDTSPEIITTNFTWGLIPTSQEKEFRKNTLNARVETLEQKAAFAPCVTKRCLVIVTAYFDWHWEDEKGKVKKKYQINSQEHEIFCLAGIYNSWKDSSNEQHNTYSIVTTVPNETMRFIHNRKSATNDERMPIMINHGDESQWLDPKHHPLDFAFPGYKPSLIGFPV